MKKKLNTTNSLLGKEIEENENEINLYKMKSKNDSVLMALIVSVTLAIILKSK